MLECWNPAWVLHESILWLHFKVVYVVYIILFILWMLNYLPVGAVLPPSSGWFPARFHYNSVPPRCECWGHFIRDPYKSDVECQGDGESAAQLFETDRKKRDGSGHDHWVRLRPALITNVRQQTSALHQLTHQNWITINGKTDGRLLGGRGTSPSL